MNNEPVAWMNPSQVVHGFIDARTYWLEGFIPLYTHPAKTLTDEEIIKTMVQFDVYSADDQCLIEAGRAILKKASEK